MTDPGSVSYEKYLRGDDEGMAELIRLYRDGLILYLNTYTGNLQEAEDLAMDAFVKLGVKKPKNRGIASFKTWFYTIARNITISYLRKKARLKEVSLEDCPEMLDDEANLEQKFIRKERLIQVHHSMQNLSTDYRQILWLTYFEGFAAKQSAIVMNKSVHGTEALLSRARKALRRQMEEEGFVYEDI